MRHEERCYYCGEIASTREHIPPKSFFPRGGNLQLRTVPSCPRHNNAKSGDDQYLLAQITLHAGKGENLPKQIFLRSIKPQLERMPSFRQSLTVGAIDRGDGLVGYPVDVARVDSFFDHLCRAIYYAHYQAPFDDRAHQITHLYFSFTGADGRQDPTLRILRNSLKSFYERFANSIASYDAAKIDEYVYQNKIIAPAGRHGSVTIAHTFYGVFEVASLLSRVPQRAV